ncbi:AAA family ATPase [Anaerobacillus sp. CMMVII]|uniref:AAA family ATPase n=1 Tax=Anaerobacillus sp. CMMVII TaxID=2755588 RepID=UPI0021C4CA58|nr:AAA family ATPase [Anaerobacillus sp. CMMVII]
MLQAKATVDVNDITLLIGTNDIGRSTILEALEIFFTNSLVKIGHEDVCVYSENQK